MSRYAMEWARRQSVPVEAKIVLILVADRATSVSNRHTITLDSIASDASLSEAQARAAVRLLEDRALIATKNTRKPDGQPTIRVDLLIPAGWATGRLRASKAQPSKTPDLTALYRLYDANGTLLYTGIARSPRSRFQQHAQDKSWWAQVAVREIEWLETRADALAAEAIAIATEKPMYNEQNVPSRSQAHMARAAAARAMDEASGRFEGWVD